MKYCTKCGAQNDDESQICCNCQNPLYNPYPQSIPQHNESVVFCTKCGTQNPKENQVCCNCQNPLFHPQDKTSKPNPPKKKIVICILAIIALVILFVVLISTHIICINHDWDVPTCIEPAKCTYCGKYKDNTLGNHKWVDATCTNAKTCSECNLKDGEPLGHTWQEATCTTSKTCLQCGSNTGKPSEHIEDEWIVTQEATLVDEGTEKIYCSFCGVFLDSRSIDKKYPEVDGKSFNFTDEEFIDWIENISALEFTLMDTGEQNTTYAIKNTNNDKTGVLILNHKKYDVNGEICLIAMYMFDDNTAAMAIVTYIGEEIDSAFSSDDAFTKLYYDSTYIKAGMTSTMLELMDDMDFAVLTPTAYLEYILS